MDEICFLDPYELSIKNELNISRIGIAKNKYTENLWNYKSKHPQSKQRHGPPSTGEAQMQNKHDQKR